MPAYRIGSGRSTVPNRNRYKMKPGRAYTGGSADFDESTGTYRSGRVPAKAYGGYGNAQRAARGTSRAQMQQQAARTAASANQAKTFSQVFRATKRAAARRPR